jgi:hypothetical protein
MQTDSLQWFAIAFESTTKPYHAAVGFSYIQAPRGMPDEPNCAGILRLLI